MKDRGASRGAVWLIGDPVSHSLSPLLHNAAFKKVGLPWDYVPLRLLKGQVGPFLRILRHGRTMGINVTVPHKEAAARWVDRKSPLAQSSGAVNCIRVRGGRLEGYNTDGTGFIEALEREADYSARGKRIAILGAGGAARGISFALAEFRPASIVVLNRTPARGRKLARDLKRRFRNLDVAGVPMGEWVRDVDLLVQTTSVGLDGRSHLRFPFDRLKPSALVADVIYRPRRTPFLRDASRWGLRTLGGWAMFLYQAAESFRIWTGMEPPVGLMRRKLLRALTA